MTTKGFDTMEDMGNQIAEKTKDAFNRKGKNESSAQKKPELPKTPEDKGASKGDDDGSSEKRHLKDKLKDSAKKGAKKTKDTAVKSAKKGAKQAIHNKLNNSDSLIGKAYRANKKMIAKAKKARKYISWLVKYIQFCLSNPIGWICGIITIVVLGTVTADVVGSLHDMGVDELATSVQTSDDQINDNTNTDGEKATVLLIDCGPRKRGGAAHTGTSSASASQADWTKEGTVAYKNAKAVFDAWVNAGISGEAASGVVGWVNTEGSFDIIGRAEGHYGHGINDSISKGAVPIPSGDYPVGGGGIYQFTPYTKYAPLNDPKWEDGKAMTEFVISELPGNWIPQAQGIMHDMTGTPHTFEQFAQETDPTQATLMWNSYERGDQKVIPKAQKQADATKANEIFNKDNHKFDRAKFDKNFGGSKSGGKSGSTSTSEKKKIKCKEGTGGGDGWQAKGGKHNYSNGQVWKPQDLPEDLKQYAIDPKSLGMEYAKSGGWDPVVPHQEMCDQCTGLSATLMHHLWEKDGRHPTQLMGHGRQVVGNWVSTYGGNSTKEPVSGSVFSTPGPTEYGHTGVVSHVFDDGSILIVEQNYAGASGERVGKYTWNYRIASADTLKSEGYTFYNPGDNGFKVNPAAKSM